MSFGHSIRALRLGWEASTKKGCWVRIAVVKEGVVCVQLHPLDGLVPARNNYKYHYVIRGRPDVIDAIPQLKHVVRVKRHIEYIVRL